jgi:DNA-binding CsgD family transcriptional regulator
MAADNAYLEIVESIYDAATDPSLWSAALEKLAAPSHGIAFMTLRNLDRPPVGWSNLVVGMEQDWLAAYLAHYSSRVAWVKTAVPSRPVGKATPSEAVIRRSDLFKTEWGNDFLRPQGLISGIGVTVFRERDQLMSAGLFVPEKAEAKQAAHVALVQRVTPHLQRALKVNRQLSGADFRWQAAEECFDRLAVGVVMLSPNMTIRFANAEAERILRQQDGLGRDRDGRLLAGSSDDDALLRASVRSLAADPQATEADRGSVLRIRRRSVERPYGVLVAAARPPHGLFGREERSVILFISEGQSREPSREQLATTFGLTLAESRLLQVLLQGHGLTEAADRLGNSVNTAKTHLRALFEKLDCSRQSDLVRTVTSHPVWLAGRGTSKTG